ncbi:hypothetical protein DNTS_033431 [Danionella cerebrum]|uniref:Uncharacterized protein n=1 Tax=Danionella cerebrum TaxID=2873325 RepID=A0A553R914_9TELE|nr:hypothetical protein DNTS_033431 [Danionella translucida]TRY98679.1 hypothetical protein DNTS_033431 [Danionella translucida]
MAGIHHANTPSEVYDLSSSGTMTPNKQPKSFKNHLQCKGSTERDGVTPTES